MDGKVMDDREVRIVRAFQAYRHIPKIARRLRNRIRTIKCTLCEQVIGNKQWRLHGDAVVCCNCTYDIGGQG